MASGYFSMSGKRTKPATDATYSCGDAKDGSVAVRVGRGGEAKEDINRGKHFRVHCNLFICFTMDKRRVIT